MSTRFDLVEMLRQRSRRYLDELRASEAEVERLRSLLEAALDTGDWYVRCLEDVQEAKLGWTNALFDARSFLTASSDSEVVRRRPMTRDAFERFERGQFLKDEARFNAEQEAGDAWRDELQEHEISELMEDGE